MIQPCDLKIHINGEHTIFLHRILCAFSVMLTNTVKKQEKKKKIQNHGAAADLVELSLSGFPGGAAGFELVSSFCYSGGKVTGTISPNTAGVLLAAAEFLGITTEDLAGAGAPFCSWTWEEIISSLKICDPFSHLADNLVASLLSKISANSQAALAAASTPIPSNSSTSSSSSPSSSSSSSSSCFSKEWWFDDLADLPPCVVEKVTRKLGAYGDDNKNLILTRFLLHYLRSAAQKPGDLYGGLEDTAVNGVVLMAAGFSCRALFWILSVVSGAGVRRRRREALEGLIGTALDQATLNDLLVSGGGGGGVYDVGLVLRLIRVFVAGGPSIQRLKKVGKLVDMYSREIAPDQELGLSMFLAIVESLPDSARDCSDGVYRALDIFLESHPGLPWEERTRACGCINYRKLTLEACKDLARNVRIPPRVAMDALSSQQQRAKIHGGEEGEEDMREAGLPAAPDAVDDEVVMRMNMEMMRLRMVELEKACRSMKGQMSKMAKSGRGSGSSGGGGGSHSRRCAARGLPRLC